MRVLPATPNPTVPSLSLPPIGPRSSTERHCERTFFFAAWIFATAALQRGTDRRGGYRALEEYCRRDAGSECPALADARVHPRSNRFVGSVEEGIVLVALRDSQASGKTPRNVDS